MCNLNVIVVLEFISRDLYLLFAIRFCSKFQNSVFYQHMRPKSGLKFPRPLTLTYISGSNKLPNAGGILTSAEFLHINKKPMGQKQNFDFAVQCYF